MHCTSDNHTHITIHHNSDFSGIAYLVSHQPGKEVFTWAVHGPSLAAGIIRVDPMGGPSKSLNTLSSIPPMDVATRAVALAITRQITGNVIGHVEQIWVEPVPTYPSKVG